MGECEPGCATDMLLVDEPFALEGGQSPRGQSGDDVATDSVDAEPRARGRDAEELAIGKLDVREAFARRRDPLGEALLVLPPASDEGLRIAFEGDPAGDDLRTLVRVRRSDDLDPEAEAIEELGAELALLHVHRPDKEEARGVCGGDRLALDADDTRRSGVEQRVDEVVREEVDLVDVQNPLMGTREQARLEGPVAGQCPA
jgi:hypothetical protein